MTQQSNRLRDAMPCPAEREGGASAANPHTRATRVRVWLSNMAEFETMSNIDDYTIQRIKDAADIVEVVSDFKIGRAHV